jgi:hypothetical protein
MLDFLVGAGKRVDFLRVPAEAERPAYFEWHRKRTIHVHCWAQGEFWPVVAYGIESLGHQWEHVDGFGTADPTADGIEFGFVLRKGAPSLPPAVRAAQWHVAIEAANAGPDSPSAAERPYQPPPAVDRRARILELIDVDRDVGIELGPLDSPVVERGDRSIHYVDHVDTEQLRRHYGDDPNVGDVVDVDIVLADRRLSEAVEGLAPVDYVVASHVVEHVPDLIGWLADLAAVIRPGGVLSLAIPDKRYCFDVKRRCTELSELVDAHLNELRQPSIAQVFDFHAKAAFSITTAMLWAGDDTYRTIADDDLGALRVSRRVLDGGGDVEVHCTVFTDASFLDLVGRLFVTGLVPDYELAAFHPTEPAAVEFHVSLRRLPDDLAVEERRARQLRSLPSVPGRRPEAITAPSDLSTAEARLIGWKRQAMTVLRRLPGQRQAEAWARQFVLRARTGGVPSRVRRGP